jgi:transcriptional regulator with XRE-family HTH domain
MHFLIKNHFHINFFLDRVQKRYYNDASFMNLGGTNIMPTIEQIRAARALLDWSQSDLADNAGLSQTGIARIENGTNKPNSNTLEKIKAAFDDADIEFLGDSGVKKRTDEVKIYRGSDGFKSFMDDLYETIKEKGGDICLHNARPENWYKWLGEEWFKMHSKRMSTVIKPSAFRIIAQEGNSLFISKDFATYKWFPDELFNDQSFYAFDDKLAFVTFGEDDVVVRVLKNRQFTEGFRVLFNIAWDYVAREPVGK